MPDATASVPLHYASAAADPAGPQQRLSLIDAVGIIVGVVVGAGIFETAGTVAQAAGGPAATLLLWLAGGAASLVGALCYAELATAYPRNGGEYVFLTRAYGGRVGFLFAWTEFWIVRPGSIGAMAYVFAKYAWNVLPAGTVPIGAVYLIAAGAVAVLTAINLIGVRSGALTQNVLTLAKALGIGFVIVAGLLLSPPARQSGGPSPPGDLRLALILVLFTYGGWNEIAYVAAEVRRPSRNIVRSLVIGTTLVSGLYVLFSLAVLRRTPRGSLGHDEAWVFTVVNVVDFDHLWVFLLLVCVSSLGAVQGMIFAGSRIYYAVGAEHGAYRWLGRWDARGGTPVRSLLAQGAVTLLSIVGFGRFGSGFDSMVMFTTPVFYFFFLLTAVSLFVLRVRDRGVPRPFRVPLYPVTPALFVAGCAFMLWSSLTYAWDNRRWEALWSIGLLLAGVVASAFTTPAKSGALAPA
jgi:APA family basic amino acid/polyamine antiporter